MVKYTKARVLQEFKGAFYGPLKQMGNDKAGKNELFFRWVDTLVKQGMVTQSQWDRWANPF